MVDSPLFRRMLIANRGEIAIRIAQTCREMGIRTIAVYSSAETNALHVRACDEAACIGGPAPLESYLNAESILRVARELEADAVHPGYGFLAESPEFARAVVAAGLVWIGPSPEAVALMGDKLAAKALAQSIGIPVIPGYDGDDQSMGRMSQEAERIGFPVMVKAAAGGGGRGMRLVMTASELPAALEGAKREARSAFGDDRVFLEKLVVSARHIEIQVFLDDHGAGGYLGERDCSIQRRNQKVIEESPSPVLNNDLRVAMGEAALSIARAGGYTNAGTVEFLLGDDRYYFLEMNARIQVEHPVTEAVTGLDLIRLQLQVAAKQPLGLSQLDIQPRGHAIEARIFAEDANAGFLPSTGTLELFRPPAGPGVRNDVGVEEGSIVTSHYDAMLAKLIVYAGDRESAVPRLTRALAEYRLSGVTTNLGFLRWIASSSAFIRGRTDTGFIDREWTGEGLPALTTDILAAASIFEATAGASAAAATDGARHDVWTRSTHWRLGRAPRIFTYQYASSSYVVELTLVAWSEWVVTCGETSQRYGVRSWEAPRLLLATDGGLLELEVFRESPPDGQPAAITVQHGSDRFVIELPSRTGRSSAAAVTGNADVPRTPMPGTIVRVLVTPGERVSAHQPLVVLEAMKMEHTIHSSRDAVIKRLLVTEGESTAAGAPVVEFESTDAMEGASPSNRD